MLIVALLPSDAGIPFGRALSLYYRAGSTPTASRSPAAACLTSSGTPKYPQTA